MRILITTGVIYPKIGGPAEYSKNLKSSFEKMGHKVSISTFSLENYLPTGLRHFYFLVKIIPKVISSDFTIIMDSFSVGLPSVLVSKILGKKSVIRSGGDFLWESYVERTKKKVLFRNFYKEERDNFTAKEKLIFKLSRWTLQNTSKIIFSTEWQRDIFIEAYSLEKNSTTIVENYYGPKEESVDSMDKTFVGSSRQLVWKNLDTLYDVFVEIPQANLFLKNLTFEAFMDKIKASYAVILVSLGDISPNMILDAIRHNKPFICTKEIGIYDRIKEAGLFVDPLNKEEIKQAVLSLLDNQNYEKAKEKVRNFSFVHTWDEISKEFLEVYNSIK